MIWLVILTCCSLGKADAIAGNTYEQNLTEHIQQYLTKNSPPPQIGFNKTVFCVIDLYQLLNVDEKHNTINAKIWFYCWYSVPEMEWNPSDYGNLSFLTFDRDTFWVPDVTINSMTNRDFQSFTAQYVRNIDGTVIAIATTMNAKLSCHFDLTHFPYDEHECVIPLRQWISDVTKYNLAYPTQVANGNQQMPLTNYISHDQWELIEPVEVEKTFAKFLNATFHQQNYKVRIKRHPQYFMRILVYPSLSVYGISILSFFLPFESGEKISLTITILLAQVVNLLVLSGSIPASSNTFPIFGEFVLWTIFSVGTTVLVAVITLNIYYKKPTDPPPRFIRRLLHTRIAWIVGASKVENKSNFERSKISPKISAKNEKSSPANEKILYKLEKIEDIVGSSENESQVQEEWQLAALMIDRVCGYIYFVFAVASMFLFSPLNM